MSDIKPLASKPLLPSRWFMRFFWQAHRRPYRVNGGRFGLRRPKPSDYGILCLDTIGRRTGQEHNVMVGYFEGGANFVTMVMSGWDEADPAWRFNLQAHPAVTAHLVDGSVTVAGRAALGEEHERLWDQWTQIDKNLDGYASRRPAETAVVVLEPQLGTSPR